MSQIKYLVKEVMAEHHHHGLCGGSHECAVTAEDTARVNGLTAAINAKLGTHHESFTVDKCSHQVVAGSNHHYHLTAKPGNVAVTVTIFEPLPHTGLPCSVEHVSLGHNKLQIGHWNDLLIKSIIIHKFISLKYALLKQNNDGLKLCLIYKKTSKTRKFQKEKHFPYQLILLFLSFLFEKKSLFIWSKKQKPKIQ